MSDDVQQQAELKRQNEAKTWSMVIHLSLLAGYTAAPVAGWLAPIVIWQVKKNDLPEIDAHGKMVVNWIISSLIYAFVSGLLTMVLIGIPMLIALWAVGIIFPIIGGIKANNGILWKYPLTIEFIK